MSNHRSRISYLESANFTWSIRMKITNRIERLNQIIRIAQSMDEDNKFDIIESGDTVKIKIDPTSVAVALRLLNENILFDDDEGDLDTEYEEGEE
jgi:hypothetical protein